MVAKYYFDVLRHQEMITYYYGILPVNDLHATHDHESTTARDQQHVPKTCTQIVLPSNNIL